MTPTISTPRYDLYLGDCLELVPLLRPVDAVVTDPPYGLGEKMQGGTWGAKNKKMMQWDIEAKEQFVLPLLSLAPLVVIWGGNYYELPLSRGWLSWFKPDAPPTMANFELAWTNQDRNARQLSHSITATNPERVGHPTQKPVRLMSWSMEQIGVPDDALVLDSFMGSGSTGVACIRTGRRFIGIEQDEHYFELAAKRLHDESAHLQLFQ